MDLDTPTASPPSGKNDPTFELGPTSCSATVSSVSRPSAPKTNFSDVTDGVKEEVVEHSPDGKRCLVTRDAEQLHCCRLIERTIDPMKLDQLALAWGCMQEGIQVNSYWNLLWLRQDMHKAFHHFDWALVPTLKVLRKMLTFDIMRENGPSSDHYLEEFPHKIWEYYLVPFRPSPTAFERVGDNLQDYATHNYPFPDLGPLKSHVHPFFVVYNTGRKAHYHKDRKKKEPHSDTNLVSQHSKHLNLCDWLYISWRKQAAECLSDVSGPAPRGSKRSGSSAGPSVTSSEQEYIYRDEQTQRQAFATRNLSQSRSDTGIPQSRKSMPATMILDSYLPTPEHSVNSGGFKQHPGAIPSGDSLSSCHWTGMDDWVAGVKSSTPCEDPYQGGTEEAEQSLLQYSYEEARSTQVLQ